MSKPKDVINAGEINKFGAAALDTELGTVLNGGYKYARIHREQVAVASNAATTKHAMEAVLAATVSGGTGGNGKKTVMADGATLAAGQAKIGGTTKTVSFFAGEVTGAAAVVDITYLTFEAPYRKDGTGPQANTLDTDNSGLTV